MERKYIILIVIIAQILEVKEKHWHKFLILSAYLSVSIFKNTSDLIITHTTIHSNNRLCNPMSNYCTILINIHKPTNRTF